ncbi:hypothetical protein AV530_010837 [Patagioenas fasciata monilis]|uniref:DOMON domain-containing protein n=1 Tax=Patagioenas fasciata monilis TaxID=372326 RepID=A0A1V4K7V1_PATFA|nr:hypothetical protein AV530_010837 [Patagioenas fasciata monilis]
MLFLLFLPYFCFAQPAPPLLRFSNHVLPPLEEVITFELQVHTTGWVAFGFGPHGELPGFDIVIGGVFPNDSIFSSFAVPAQETKYACAFIPLPMVKQKHHIYKFEPVITPHNITLVHHILVYACGNAIVLPSDVGDCYGANSDFSLCSQVLVGWAVGGEMNGMLVPDLCVFAYLLHTYLSDRGVKGAQYRDGEQLGIFCEDNKYDFRLQEIRDMKEILIMKPVHSSPVM